MALAQEAHKQAVKQAKKDRSAAFLAKVDASIEGGPQELHPWKPVTRSQLKSKDGITCADVVTSG